MISHNHANWCWVKCSSVLISGLSGIYGATNVVLMLVRRLRRRPIIKTTVGQRLSHVDIRTGIWRPWSTNELPFSTTSQLNFLTNNACQDKRHQNLWCIKMKVLGSKSTTRRWLVSDLLHWRHIDDPLVLLMVYPGVIPYHTNYVCEE